MFIVLKEIRDCVQCKALADRGGWDEVDLMIYHRNGHSWPGYAGEPDSGNYGGSDY